MRDVLHNFSVFVDGFGYFGKAKTVSVPVLTMKTEEYLGSGMSTPADVHLGTEKLTMDITFNSIELSMFQLFGLSPGNIKPFTCHGALASTDGTKKGITLNARGFINEINEGTWEANTLGEMTVAISLHYYKRLEDGVSKLEISAFDGIINSGGVDQTSWIKDRLYYS